MTARPRVLATRVLSNGRRCADSASRHADQRVDASVQLRSLVSHPTSIGKVLQPPVMTIPERVRSAITDRESGLSP